MILLILDSPSMKLTNYSIIIVLNPEGSLNEQWKGIIGVLVEIIILVEDSYIFIIDFKHHLQQIQSR